MTTSNETEIDTGVRGPDGTYTAYVEQGSFRIQLCSSCTKHVFFPRVICPHCGSVELGWVEPSGRGTIYAASLIMGKPGTGTDYAIVLVDLEEGVRMMSRVEGCAQDQVCIGLPVQAQIVERDGRKLVVFVPREHQKASATPAMGAVA